SCESPWAVQHLGHCYPMGASLTSAEELCAQLVKVDLPKTCFPQSSFVDFFLHKNCSFFDNYSASPGRSISWARFQLPKNAPITGIRLLGACIFLLILVNGRSIA